jgi:hypothetical protein
VSSVESELKRLADVTDANTEAFSDSLRVLESMGFVMQRVMNDVLAGQVRRVEGTSQIDFQSYLVEFWTCQVFAEFAGWLASLQKPEENKIVTPTQNDVVVFGGD